MITWQLRHVNKVASFDFFNKLWGTGGTREKLNEVKLSTLLAAVTAGCIGNNILLSAAKSGTYPVTVTP